MQKFIEKHVTKQALTEMKKKQLFIVKYSKDKLQATVACP